MSNLESIKELLTEAAGEEASAEPGLKLVAALERVQKFTDATRKQWHGHIGDHWRGCFTEHPQCLAQLIAASIAGELA